jgi:S-(hydroxymethyl)glutathione dehydrogenase / alcohol dehydrogenase
MSTTARVVVLPPGGRALEIQPVNIPDPGPFEVVVEQRATGICHSQIDHIASADPAKPLVLGHESAGIVVAAGDQVEHVGIGDNVLVTWLPRSSSRKAQPVRIPLGCGDWAVTRNVFTWGTHCVADEQYVVKAPKGLPADLVSIVGCAIMTGAGAVLNCAAVTAGKSAAVWGVGGVGLPAVAAARNLGASPVIAVDIDEGKLRLAKHMGADHVVNARETDAVAEIRRLTQTADGTDGVDYSIDCTGRADNLPKSLAAVRPGIPGQRPGGTSVLVGAIRTSFELPGMELINGQKRLAGCLGGACVPERDFPVFLDWFQAGRLDLAALVTDRYRLDQVNEGVEDLRRGRITGRAVIEL